MLRIITLQHEHNNFRFTVELLVLSICGNDYVVDVHEYMEIIA